MLLLIKAILAWLFLSFVGTNLIGFSIRGLFCAPPPFGESEDSGVRELLEREFLRQCVASIAVSLFFLVVTVGYVFALYRYWNLGLALSGVLLMVSRLPDLFWEIRTGRRATMDQMPNGIVHFLSATLSWLSLPLIWYSFLL